MKITYIIRALADVLTLPIIGFILMLAGPAILILAGLFTSVFGYVPGVVAGIIAWTAIILPGIGAVINGIVLLFFREETGVLGYALASITVIMCNPIFYLFYFAICRVTSRNLAGTFLVGM